MGLVIGLAEEIGPMGKKRWEMMACLMEYHGKHRGDMTGNIWKYREILQPRPYFFLGSAKKNYSFLGFEVNEGLPSGKLT
jgi:hypothetical protein